MATVNITADILDSRDIITAVEELVETLAADPGDTDAAEEYDMLTETLEELSSYFNYSDIRDGMVMVAESYFEEYAQELVEEIYPDMALPHFVVIDWETTADNIREDYEEISVGGNAYWTRP